MRRSNIFIILLMMILVFAVTACGKDESMNTLPDAEYVEIDRVEAPYEHWLAAAVITGIAMDYPDFEIKEVLLAEENAMEHYKDSQGIYVCFTTTNETKCIKSYPIDALRKEQGFFDIHAEYIGYATYDEVDIEEINRDSFKVVELENINTLIEQLERVTTYMN